MVKGTPKIRSFAQSKEDPPMKAKEARHNTSPARPPLSAFSASARNNLSAGNISTTHPASNSQAKFDRRRSQVKIRGGLSGQVSYPQSESADSLIVSSSSNSSSPERFNSPSGTPLKGKSKRSGSTQLLLGSADLENVQERNSTAGIYEERVSRTSSDPSIDEATTTDDSDPSSTSGSEAENVDLSRPSSPRRQEGLRRMSLGPKIEAAVTKFNSPCKPLIPLAGRFGTPCPSPGSLRAGVPRALVLQQPDLKDLNQAQSHFDLQENLSFWDDHSVQVVIRTRPISGKEVARQDFSRCLRQDGPHAITWLGQPETRFTFDHVAGENISQEKLFKVVGLPIVENCMAGYNSCMFAYGQTGSGKTHTMLGDITGLGDRPSDNRGMTPRIFEYLFSKIQQEERDRQLDQLRYVCKCSFLEIYNEQITDLLEPSSSNLQMREDSKKGVYVENLTEIVVSSVHDVVLLLLKGAASRKVASTNMNRESSRSHSVFTCSIESKWETNSLSNMRFGRLNLVDLAGSERQKSSRAEGDRLKEAASINKSLSTLGLVIMALVDIANGRPRHVPYRDSKLTFLLQDSLGGNSKTAIIATISPSSCCSMETLSTLKFAQRAKFIQNNAVVNEDASGDILALQREIQQLKEEVSRLRCQSISSIRRECRRDSNEFFRLSMTGRDLFDAAEKERTNEGAELKSEELLEKIKALEQVLAGALRREQEAENATKQLSAQFEKANKLIEEREIEVRNYKNLLHLHAHESRRLQSSDDNAPSSDLEQHVILTEKLEIAGSLEYNSTVTKLELENLQLTEQLRSYQTFIDVGEKEMMAAEIQGLRDQVLELLDRKIAVEPVSLSIAAQDDSYRKELETCRNDLTKCLEASSQLQRQVDELHSLVNQLTAQCANKEKELDLMKESTVQYANIAKLKEEEIDTLQSGWEIATAKLFCNLVEGERALIEVGREMDEILGEDWLLKNFQDNPVRWSIESVKSLKEVDVEHDYFKGRDSCYTDDIFSEKRISRRTRSSGITPRVSIVSEEKLKMEASVARLEQELEDHKQRALTVKQIQEELDRVEREKRALKEEVEELVKNSLNTTEILEEKADLKVEVQKLLVQLHEENEMTETLRAQISALDRKIADLEEVKLEQAEALVMRSQEASGMQEENLKLLHETAILSQDLKDVRVNAEETHAALMDTARVNDEQTKKNALLKLQADKDAVQQTCLSSTILNLESSLKTQQEEMTELETEIERLEFSLHEAECRHQELETTMKADKESIVALEEAKQKLDSETKIISQKLALTDTVQEELRMTVSSLHVELEKKIKRIEESDLQAMSKADGYVRELNLSAAALNSCEGRIGELEASVAEKSETLEKLGEALMSVTVTCDAVKMERDEVRAHAGAVQAEATLSSTEIQDLRENLDLKSIELQILSDLMQVITTEMNTHIVHSQSTSQTLSQDLENERAALRALQHQLLCLTTTLEQKQADLLESKRKENNLLAQILSLKEQLLKSECNVDVTREAETCLQGELLALSEIVKSTSTENDCLKEELAALQALVLEHHSTMEVNQLKIETDVQTITLLNETVEDLKTQLQRKEDLLHGLEFDLSMLQEHAAEDTDFKQELLKANAKILELQEAVQTRCEELKVLGSTKNDVEEQLALNTAAMTLVEERLLNSETEVALANTERQKLSSRVSRMQSSTSLLEAELAEKNEALSSQEQELIDARDFSTRMTMECSHKSEAFLSLQGEMLRVGAERDDLKLQCSTLVEKVDCLQENISQQVAEVEVLHGELLVSKMTECCLQELKSDLETKAAYLEAQKAAHDADLAHTNENMKQLDFKLLRTSETVAQLKQETGSLEAYIAELQAERACLNSQLAQRNESESSLQDRILAVSESSSRSQAEQDKMKRQIDDFQSLKCRLERDLALKIDAVNSLEAELMAARTQIAQSLEQNAELRARVSAFEEKYCNLERDVILENDAFSSMAAELSAAQVVTSSMARDLDDMNWRITALISEKENLENKILQKDEAMGSMDVELTAMKDSVFRLESLKSELSELELQKSRDEEELKIARKTQVLLQDEIQAVTNKFADSQESNNALKLELAENITVLSSLEDELSMASGSSSYNLGEMKVMKAGIGALLKERDSLQAEVDHKSATISSLEAELVGAQDSAESSRDCIAAMETKVVALQAERDGLDTQITELERGVISTLRVELTEAQKSLKFIDKEMSEAKRVADCVSYENSALQAEAVGLEAEKSTLEVDVSCKTALIMSLEAELAAAGSSSMALSEELNSFESQVLELQTLNAALETEVAEKRTSISLRESELLSTNTITSSKVQENGELRMQIDTWQQNCSAMEAQLDEASQEMDIMKAQITQQELQLSSLEELLAREAEALQHMVNSAVHATQECDTLRSEVESLKDILCTKNAEIKEQENASKRLEIRMTSVGNESDELRALKDVRDQALVEVQTLHGELRAAQALVASHKSSVLEAQKFAEVNILRASGKDEEARTLKASVSTLKNQNNELEEQLEATKHEAEKLRQSRDEFEMELQGMKNRMTMLQAVHSTGSRNFKGFQAAQAASLDLQKRLEDKETEVSQMYKRMTVLHSQNEAQASRLEEMENELAHVHQELDELQSQCEDKDAQLSALNGQLKEAETLTQDVMRDLHNVKLDISNYASLVSQQQLELIAERARHTDEAREKDEELSNLQTQLNQERQNWMGEMNHKQAEIVVARVLSEKMRLKNKTLAAEYKRLKADYGGKKKKLKFLEQQLTQITTETRRFSMGTESEADFDEVQQFQALLAQANDHERAQRN